MRMTFHRAIGFVLTSVTGLALASHAIAGSIDTGVGEQGVALESSPAFSAQGIPVDMFNLVRAETAKYFAEETILSGGNTMRHERTGIDLDNQTVIRSNFDLIYSYGVYDASGGLTVHVPDYDLYHIVQVFDENHVTIAVVYPGETASIGPEDLSFGDHVYLFMRTQPRSASEAGIRELNERQDAVVIEAASARPYVSEVVYDTESFNALRQEILVRAAAGEMVAEKGFIESVDDLQFPHYQGANIAGWAGLPSRHAYYDLLVPGNDAAANGACSSTTFETPDLQYERNGYWSLTVYDANGWVASDPFFTNSLNARANADGSYTIHINCTPDHVNNLMAPPNWNALMRLYLPADLEATIGFGRDLRANRPALPVE